MKKQQNITLICVCTNQVRAYYADAKTSDGCVIYTPPQPEFDDFMAIENHSPFWCRPFFGRDLRDIPAWTQALLLRRGERYRYILPVCADSWKTVIRGGQDGMEFRISADCAGVTDCVRQLAWVEAEGTDPLKLAHDCAEAAAALLGNGLKLRGERKYPEVLEYLGWCSWDAFQIRVSEAGLLEKAWEFRDKQVPVRFAIIDDMWADVPHLKEIPSEIGFSDMVHEMHKSPIRSFEGDPVRFPNGMKHTVEALKEAGIRNVGIWFPTTGYWFGVEPGSGMEREFANDLYTAPDGRRIVKPELPHTTHWFGSLCTKTKSWGADFVKIDNQGYQQFYREAGAIGKTARAVQTGIEGAVAEHFGGAVINCMGMPSECMFNRPDSAVSRCSDDFQPENRAWFTKNILQCAYNGILQGQFYVNDWDMWWTDDGQAEKNSLCRAISGGPVYVSDKLGRTNPEILRPVCLPDGRLLRPDESATPTADCLTSDPRTSKKLFKLRNKAREFGILAAFDLDEQEQPVSGSIGAADVGFSPETPVAVYDWFGKTCRTLASCERMKVALADAEDCWLWWIIPYTGGVKMLGLTDLYVGCLAPEANGDGAWNVPCGGELALLSDSPVRLEVDGQPLSGRQDGILWRFTLPEKTGGVRIVVEK